MTKEEIIKMAMLEAEFVSHGKPSEEASELFLSTDKDIVRFAKLVAEKEREECAKIFDDAKGTGRIASCREAADAIRARGQK